MLMYFNLGSLPLQSAALYSRKTNPVCSCELIFCLAIAHGALQNDVFLFDPLKGYPTLPGSDPGGGG